MQHLDREKCKRVWFMVHHPWLYFVPLARRIADGDVTALMELYGAVGEAEGLGWRMVRVIARMNWGGR